MNIDKENTMRALGNQPLLANRQWLCRFGLHTWTKWSEEYTIRRAPWEFTEQKRSCGCCGKVELKELYRG